MRAALNALGALLGAEWLEGWRRFAPRHDLRAMKAVGLAIAMGAATGLGGASYWGFAAMRRLLGPEAPPLAVWLGPFLTIVSYGWIFLAVIWLSRTYRRRERLGPLLASPLPGRAIAAYLRYRDTGLPLALLTMLGLPFVLGGLLGAGAPALALVAAPFVWGAMLLGGLALAEALVVTLFRVLPAGFEGPFSFAAANVGMLILPAATHGLTDPRVPLYWPGAWAASALAGGRPELGVLLLGAAALAGLGASWLSRRWIFATYSKVEGARHVSRPLARGLLKPGGSPLAALVAKDWALAMRAWGEAIVVLALFGLAWRVFGSPAGLMGGPAASVPDAPGAAALSGLLVAWAVAEGMAFVGESFKEGPHTAWLAHSPAGARTLGLAKAIAIGYPRLIFGGLAYAAVALKGHADWLTAFGALATACMIAGLACLEVPHAFEAPDPGRLPAWARAWDRFYGFWRLILVHPGLGLVSLGLMALGAAAAERGLWAIAAASALLLGAGALGAAGFAFALTRLKLRGPAAGSRKMPAQAPAPEHRAKALI